MQASKATLASGLALAAAAAALFISGCANQGASQASGTSGTVAVKCFGANACKGQSECKSEMNACKGQNTCKGHGFEMLSERACVEKLGRS